MTTPVERLQALDMVEKKIATCLSSAGLALQEMSKDKPSPKQMDNHSNLFLNTLNQVEIEVEKHINHLTQLSIGQDPSYASRKNLQLAEHRSDHTRSNVIKLEGINPKTNSQKTGSQNGPSSAPGNSNQPPTPHN